MGQITSVKYLSMKRGENIDFSCVYCFAPTKAHNSSSSPHSVGLGSTFYGDILDTSPAKLY